ncbi:basic amino acid/polyamine antiporter [Clostridium sp.]|uniref:basic amino acid/polyamine antiporter n=3 Tax=Clostridium sp. TaxID=1506 RepID=UPI002FC82AAA
MSNDKKMGLGLLVALGIGSMIGGGIFNSPTDLITSANPQATLIAWAIGGFGVIMLALIFQMLANKRPDLTGGVYSYAREGFGEFIGFNSAWGYWLSAWIGNVAFFILMFKTINSLLGEGRELSGIISFIIASIILWLVHFIITKGIKGASMINGVVTIGKLLPIILVIVFGALIFTGDTFFVENWQNTLASTGESTNIMSQVDGAMGTILWCFIGVEAATVLSEKAESQAIVGKATVLSIVITLSIYVLISVISMGVIPAEILAKSTTPLSDVLRLSVLGTAGDIVVKLGIILSLLGALLSWILLAAEIPYLAAKDRVMPKWFAKENSAGVPINSLIITNGVTQLLLLALLSPGLQSAYYSVTYIATAAILVPYLFSALFAVKTCYRDDTCTAGNKAVAILATLYSIYVIYAVGLVYLGLAFILYVTGLIPFYFGKKEKGEAFTSGEKIGSLLFIIIAIVMIVLLAMGVISL